MMSDPVWASLRTTIALRYDSFRRRLTRSLGSRDLADDALNETWLRLHRTDAVGAIQQAESYIFRMALNIAADTRRGERRRASKTEVWAAIQRLDDSTRPTISLPPSRASSRCRAARCAPIRTAAC